TTSLLSFTTPRPTETHTLSLHDALPISSGEVRCSGFSASRGRRYSRTSTAVSREVVASCARAKPSMRRGRPSVSPPRTIHSNRRSEEHTSELQSRFDLVCRLLLEKKKIQ